MNKFISRPRALLLVLALVLVVASVTGGTIAWFNDTVQNEGNVITAGNLDVALSWADGTKDPAAAETVWKDASEGAIFNYALWEPGYTQVRHVEIKNNGSLALKYQVTIEANGEVSNLADVIDVYFLDPAQQLAARSDLTAAPIGTLTQVLATMPDATSGHLAAGETARVTLALKMQESAGNDYQNLSIGSDFTIKLLATQDTVENDSFDDQYDAEAEYPGPTEVDSTSGLKAALEGGASGMVVMNDFSLTEQVVMTTGTLDGDGRSIDYGTADPNYPGYIITEGKVQNLTINLGSRSYAAFGATTEYPMSGNVNMDNITVNGPDTPFGFVSSFRVVGANGMLQVSNSNLEGHITLSNLKKASFENTTIINRKSLTGSSATGGTCALTLNCDTEFTNCHFTTALNPIKVNPDIILEGDKRIVCFNNCTYNGTEITTQNLWSQLLNLTVANKTFSKADYNAVYIFYVNGVPVTL